MKTVAPSGGIFRSLRFSMNVSEGLMMMSVEVGVVWRWMWCGGGCGVEVGVV